MGLRDVVAAFKRYPKFLVSSHVDLEGDALGSQLGVAALLEQMGKEVALVPPTVYQFLPGVERVRTDIEALRGGGFAALVAVDCPTLKRIGRVAELITPAMAIINIDHHISNERFGTVNWIEPTAAAVGEMIYDLYEHTGQPLTSQVAQALYLSLLVDTGSFRFSSTSAKTHRIASALIERGCRPHQIYESLYENMPASTVMLLSRALATLKIEEGGRLAWFQITQRMVSDVGARLEEADTFIDMARVIRGVEIVVLFIQTGPERAKVSFRSKGSIDVNRLAATFGGGGHMAASGCACEGNFEQIQRRVLTTVRGAIAGTPAAQEVSC